MKISFGGKKFKFKESFGEFTLTTIKEYMNIHSDVEVLIDEYNALIKRVEKITIDEKDLYSPDKRETRALIVKILQDHPELSSGERVAPQKELDDNHIGNLIDLDQQLTEVQFKLTGKRIDLLCILCNDDSFRGFVVNTDGVSYGVIKAALEFCIEKLGGFTNFWDDCPTVTSFKMRTKGSILRKKFKVHHFDKTSLYRETVASLQAQRALNHKTKLDNGSWDDICEFVSMIVRPSNEVEEISFARKSFIKGKKMKGMSHSDKLALYIERFEIVWKKRAKTFKELPLDIAIGVLKDFFQKKKT